MMKLDTKVILLLLPLIAAVTSAASPCPGKPAHICKSQTEITVSGMNFQCPGDLICNSNHVTPCNPCVPRTCDDAFTCTNPDITVVSIHEQDFECPGNYSCNKDMEDPCRPCVLSHCTTNKLYECGEDDKVFTVGGSTTIPCDAGKVCNRKFRHPCTPCVEDPALASRSILRLRPLH